jgi:hypothetical protein
VSTSGRGFEKKVIGGMCGILSGVVFGCILKVVDGYVIEARWGW